MSFNKLKKMEVFFKNNYCPVCGETENNKSKFIIKYISDQLLKRLNIVSDQNIELIKCKRCSHHYVSHYINPNILNLYYTNQSSEIYEVIDINTIDTYKKERRKCCLAIDKLSDKKGRILDIGCGPGYLLSYLPNDWKKFGIEPSLKAAEIAEKRGISIIGKFVEDIDSSEKFDVIILIDVMEHLVNPNEMIKKVYALLKLGGILIIETGNINSLNAKVSGSRWSYFCTYEHISFFTLKSLKYLLQMNGLNVVETWKKSHEIGFFKNVYRFVKNIAMSLFFGIIMKKKDYSSFIVYDHVFVAAKKYDR